MRDLTSVSMVFNHQSPSIKGYLLSRLLTSYAQTIIIGRGVVGCRVVYHLTRQGWKDALLLGREQLAKSITSAVDGLVRCVWTSSVLANMDK